MLIKKLFNNLEDFFSSITYYLYCAYVRKITKQDDGISRRGVRAKLVLVNFFPISCFLIFSVIAACNFLHKIFTTGKRLISFPLKITRY